MHIQNFLDHPIIQGLVLDFRDVTNQIIMQRKIEKLASYDETTSLPKQNQFKKELTEKCLKACLNQQSLIVVMLDFEGFKEINDSLGFKVGQQLIVQVVMRLRGLLGKDTLISRYSEDQFAIVIEGLINLESYEARVAEIIDFFHRSFKIDIYEFNINVNVGVSVYPLETEEKELDTEDEMVEEDLDSDEIEQLIQYADIEKLQRAGIKVALGDFGTGYSSLSYLQHFNIDIIKMDASFLKNIIADKTTAIIAQAIINLTKELRIKLVCEGIENWEQMRIIYENQVKMKKNILFSDGNFTDETAYNYFNNLCGQQSPEKVDFSQYRRNKF